MEAGRGSGRLDDRKDAGQADGGDDQVDYDEVQDKTIGDGSEGDAQRESQAQVRPTPLHHQPVSTPVRPAALLSGSSAPQASPTTPSPPHDKTREHSLLSTAQCLLLAWVLVLLLGVLQLMTHIVMGQMGAAAART